MKSERNCGKESAVEPDLSFFKNRKDVRLDDIAVLRKERFDPKTGENRPYIGLEHMTNEDLLALRPGNSRETLSQKYAFYRGDVLFGKLRPYLGKVSKPMFDGVCSEEILVITPREGVTVDYLLYLLASDKAIKHATNTSIGTKMPRTSWKFLSMLPVSVPSEKDQRRVALILGTLDSMICTTRNIIEKTDLLRAGLARALFAEGMRCEEFRDSEMGRMPQHWNVEFLPECATINPENIHPSTSPDYELQYIDISSIRGTGEVNSTKKLLFKDAPSRARRRVRCGDVIVSTVRPYLRAFAIIRSKESNLVCSTGFAVLRAREIMNSEFLYHFICCDFFVSFLTRMMAGSNYPATSSNDLKFARVVVPPLQEQKEIANILTNIERKVRIEKTFLCKLQELKRGLTQALLWRES